MAIAKVSLGFTKLSDPQLIVFCDHVIDCMTGNADYPTPSPTLSSLQISLTAFQGAAAAAKGGGVILTAQKNAARTTLIDKVRTLAFYVQQECASDLATLLSSGYEATKAPTPVGVLPAPEGVTLNHGTLSGSLNLRANGLNNAASYEMQKTTDLTTPSTWETVELGTAPRATFEDLVPGTTYWGRIRGIGSEGPGAWSEPVKAMSL